MSTFRAVAVLVLSLGLAIGAAAAENEGADVEGVLHPPGIGGARVPPPLRLVSPGSLNQVVRLVWVDPAGVGEGSASLARDEARRLLETIGLRVSWRSARVHELAQPGEIRVILVGLGIAQGNTFVLGSTPTQPGDQPFLWVHLASVRASLGLTPALAAALPEPAARRRVGTAVGRVIAHEVVHVLAPGLPHGHGLMARRLSGGDLTSSRVAIDPEVALAVRAALAGGPTPSEAAEGLVAAHGGTIAAAADSSPREVQ